MEFICKVATAGGQVLNQTEQAESEIEVRQRLAAQGYYIFSVRPKDWLRARFNFPRRRRIRADEFVIFNQQFLTLSRSGLPLQKSLELLARQARSQEMRAALEKVRDSVRSSRTLLSRRVAFPSSMRPRSARGSAAAAWIRCWRNIFRIRKSAAVFAKKFWPLSFTPPFWSFFCAFW